MSLQRFVAVIASLVAVALVLSLGVPLLPEAYRIYAVTAMTGVITPVVSGALISFLLKPVQKSQENLTVAQENILVKQQEMQGSLNEVHTLVNSSFSKVQHDLTVALAERTELLRENAALVAKNEKTSK